MLNLKIYQQASGQFAIVIVFSGFVGNQLYMTSVMGRGGIKGIVMISRLQFIGLCSNHIIFLFFDPEVDLV